MNDLLKQKSSIIALALYAIGVYLHVKGRNLSTDQSAALTQMLGVLFDVVASAIAYFSTKHAANAQQIQDNRAVLNATTPTGNLAPVPGTQEVSPTAATSINTATPPVTLAPVNPTPKP